MAFSFSFVASGEAIAFNDSKVLSLYHFNDENILNPLIFDTFITFDSIRCIIGILTDKTIKSLFGGHFRRLINKYIITDNDLEYISLLNIQVWLREYSHAFVSINNVNVYKDILDRLFVYSRRHLDFQNPSLLL